MLKNSNLLPHPATILSLNQMQPIGHTLIELQSVDSTNNYATAQVHAGLAPHGTVFFAYEQYAGKGQRGKNWASAPGENLTISIVMQPYFLSGAQQFILSSCIAVACHDFFRKYATGETSIKWPNDLYWRDRKAGGILIENIFRGSDWLFAIAGIGININQTIFPKHLSSAISLKQITGKTNSLLQLIKELCDCIEKRYRQLEQEGPANLLSYYNQFLYKKNEVVRLKKKNILFETTIRGVSEQGQLLTSDSIQRSFDFGEVNWII